METAQQSAHPEKQSAHPEKQSTVLSMSHKISLRGIRLHGVGNVFFWLDAFNFNYLIYENRYIRLIWPDFVRSKSQREVYWNAAISLIEKCSSDSR